MTSTAILWYRRDLRVHDHPALRAALDAHDRVVPVFVLDDALLHGRYASPARMTFMLGCLGALGTALRSRGLAGDVEPLVLVLSLDDAARAFATARELRAAGFRAETYTGTKKFGDQLKYADKRGAALAVIEGGDERAAGQITIKNLALGTELSKGIKSREEYLGARQAQKTVARADLVAAVRELLGR